MQAYSKSEHLSVLSIGRKAVIGIAILLFAVGAAMRVNADSPAGKEAPDTREQTIRNQIVTTIEHPKAQVITDNLSGDSADALMNSTTTRLDSSVFGKFSHICSDGSTMHFRLFKPVTTPGTKYPLVMYYNGSGNEGSDNVRQLMASVSPRLLALPEIQQKYPCYVAVPQIPDKLVKGWEDRVVPEHKEIYDLLVKTYSAIDTSRVYLAGFSAGGSLVYHELSRNPDLFAAGLAADGGGDVNNWPAIYVAHHIPLMMFCGGSKDFANPAGPVFVKRSADLGGKLTCVSFPNLNHWQVGNTFLQEPGVLDWLFAQHR